MLIFLIVATILLCIHNAAGAVNYGYAAWRIYRRGAWRRRIGPGRRLLLTYSAVAGGRLGSLMMGVWGIYLAYRLISLSWMIFGLTTCVAMTLPKCRIVQYHWQILALRHAGYGLGVILAIVMAYYSWKL